MTAADYVARLLMALTVTVVVGGLLAVPIMAVTIASRSLPTPPARTVMTAYPSAPVTLSPAGHAGDSSKKATQKHQRGARS